jgi:hypothetical protein
MRAAVQAILSDENLLAARERNDAKAAFLTVPKERAILPSLAAQRVDIPLCDSVPGHGCTPGKHMVSRFATLAAIA